MIVMGSQAYWQCWWHISDFAICGICISCLAFDLSRRVYEWQVDDYISIGLLIFRYIAQAIRVVWLFRNAQRAQAELATVDDTQIMLPSPRSNAQGAKAVEYG